MKKRLSVWAVACLAGLLCLSVLFVYVVRPWKEAEQDESEEFLRERTGAWEALQLEIEKTKDPRLGYVPKDRLLKAYRYTDQLRRRLVAARAIPGIDWNERGPNNVAGRTNALLIDANDPTGNTIWAAGSTGGLWKTTNMKASNTTWTAVNDFFANLAIVTIAQDPVDPQIMYFGTGDIDVRGLGIWKSTDGGASWTQLPNTASGGDFFDINRIVVTPAQTVLVATSTGVQRSANGGTTWTRVTSGNANEVVLASNGVVWAGLDGNLRKSVNDGATFGNNLSIPAIGTRNMVVAIAPSNPDVVYAMAATGGNVGGMIRSDDGGSTWTSLPIPRIVGGSNDFTRGQAWYDLEVAVDPENESHVWIGGIDLLRSTDKGTTWQPVSQWYGGFSLPYVHADQHFILFDKNNPKAAYFGCDGGVFSCANTRAANPAFTEKNQDYNITYFYSVALHPTAATNYIMAGAQDNGTQVMRATGIGNGTEVYGGDGMFCHIDQDNPNIHVLAYVYSNYRISTNGGASFRALDNDNSGRCVNPTDWHNVSNRLYAATTAGRYRVYLSPATETTKRDVSVPDFGSAQVSAVTCSESVADRVWFGLNNGMVVRVEDAAGNAPVFTRIRTGVGYVSCVAVDPADENHVLVTSSSYGTVHVLETRDNGTSWTNITGNIPDMPVRWAMFSPTDPDQALVATDIGVWSTDDLNGTTTDWAPSNSGLANVRTDMLQYRTSDKQVVAATYGRGVFSTDYFGSAPVNTPPVVSVAATPATATAPATISLTATASDVDGTVAKVEFYNGIALLATDLTAPYSFSWANVSAGTYSITAKATDNQGAMTTSAPVSVTVEPSSANTPPTVTLAVTPTTATAPATISLAATAADSDGTIAKVEFYNGTTLLATDLTAPYSFSWTNVSAGTYSLTAKATDNQGASTTSTPVSVTVQPAVNTPPVVSVAATPATATAPATISLTATASDVDGTVAKVEFYNGTTLLATDLTAPYSFSWTNVPSGSYTVTAKATDNLGAATTSAAVTVTVTNPTTQDISGPACMAANATGAYELNASLRTNATSYSWWYNGSTQSITPSVTGGYAVTVASGSSFSAGQICVGVNYSGPPYYKSYCMNVAVCATGTVQMPVAEVVPEIQIQSNPFSHTLTVRLAHTPLIRVAELYDLRGVRQRVQMTLTDETTWQLHTASLASGVYYLQLHTADGVKVLKVMKE